MELEFTIQELKDAIKATHLIKMQNTIDEVIKRLRYIEKEHKEGKAKFSGIEHLTLVLQSGYITMSMYLKMREIIENPETPYEITIKS
jgi:hypothetical protein